jgi:hypothetical protein
MHKSTMVMGLALFTLVACEGPEGAVGAVGPEGPQGPAGLDGIDGTNGSNGTNGTDGTNGSDGADGQDGASGVTSIGLTHIGRYDSGIFDEGAAEILAYDAGTQQLFQVNANAGAIDILDLSDPTSPSLASTLDVARAIADNTSITRVLGGVNSVAVHDGLVAAAIAADAVVERGYVAIFQTDGTFVAAYEAGVLPDSVAFSPDGRFLVTADEGEPDDLYDNDPEGSVTVIDLQPGAASASVTRVTFEDFNASGSRAAELDPEIRIFGVKSDNTPSTVAEDLEPEYVAFTPDSTQAVISLQENNALAVIDLATPGVHALLSLGVKDHYLSGNGLDASDRDGRTNIERWPVWGLYQPDTIATYSVAGQPLVVTANEGDTRDYEGFSEEARIKDLTLDPVAFPDPNLQSDAQLGRLLTTTTLGDEDGDGDVDSLYSIGGRSFSIYTLDGTQLFDSGDQFESILARRLGTHFNSDNDENSSDTRSDAKGPEPEALAIGTIGGAHFAFIGLERQGGVMVYNISNPQSPRFVTYALDRDFSVEPSLGDTNNDGIDESNPAAGHLGPESIVFVPAEDSPTSDALVIVGNEVSGTTAIYRVDVIAE